MYLAGVSVRRVEDITEALWGTRVSPITVSNLNKKIYAKIEAGRNRPIEGERFSDGRSMSSARFVYARPTAGTAGSLRQTPNSTFGVPGQLQFDQRKS
jgi:hypothetical protein